MITCSTAKIIRSRASEGVHAHGSPLNGSTVRSAWRTQRWAILSFALAIETACGGLLGIGDLGSTSAGGNASTLANAGAGGLVTSLPTGGTTLTNNVLGQGGTAGYPSTRTSLSAPPSGGTTGGTSHGDSAATRLYSGGATSGGGAAGVTAMGGVAIVVAGSGGVIDQQGGQNGNESRTTQGGIGGAATASDSTGGLPDSGGTTATDAPISGGTTATDAPISGGTTATDAPISGGTTGHAGNSGNTNTDTGATAGSGGVAGSAGQSGAGGSVLEFDLAKDLLSAVALDGDLSATSWSLVSANRVPEDMAQDLDHLTSVAKLSSRDFSLDCGSRSIFYWKPVGLTAPLFSINTGIEELTCGNRTISPGRAAGHPWMDGKVSQYADAVWTAPRSGKAEISASFFAVEAGATTEVCVLVRGRMSGCGNVVGSFLNSREQHLTVPPTNVAAGDQVEFAIGPGNGDYSSDATGIDVHIILTTP